MTKWSFEMIDRDEYERVCEENRELKAELRNLIKRINKVGESLDAVGAVERVGESREQKDD